MTIFSKNKKNFLKGDVSIVIIGIIVVGVIITGMFAQFKNPNFSQGILVNSNFSQPKNSLQLQTLNFVTITPTPILTTPVSNAFPVSTVSPLVSPVSTIFLIVMENHDYSQIIGNSAAPYINTLSQQYALSANYQAITHPSLPNYFALVTGETIIPNDCNNCIGQKAPTIADQLEKVGKTWKGYIESMPKSCALNDAGPYVQRHNPFVYFSSLQTSGTCAKNDVSYTNFHSDLASGSVGNFNFIVPNVDNDMHDGTIQQGDNWLKQEVPQILNSSAYKNNGVLMITWDEGTDNSNQIVTLVISPLGKKSFTSKVSYTHYSLLRTIENAFGLPPLGNAANASAMSDMFTILL